MSGQKNDAAGSVEFFRQSLCDLFFFPLGVDIEMGEDALHLRPGRVYVQWLVIGIGNFFLQPRVGRCLWSMNQLS